METSTHRPYEDGDEITLLGAHPIDKLTCEEVGNGIEKREIARDGTIIGVSPVEIGSDKILPS
jgi:hypothetical protein